MSDISRALASLQEDFKSADKLVDDIYNRYFSRFFKREVELYDKFQEADTPITDKELEWILLYLPLDLKMASNSLAQFKQHNEIVKLKVKQRKSSGEDDASLDEEFKLMTIIYSSVITRVELDISFSKELIMGAKKVWDARRSTDASAPISESVVKKIDLPDYKLEPDSDVKVQF